MSTSQYALNVGLLVYILATNLGTHRLTRARLLMPLALIAVAGAYFLGDVPTAGNDVQLEVLGALTGAALGVLAGVLVKVDRTPAGTVTQAGTLYAALWVAVIGGRVAFAYGAQHWFSRDIGQFSITHQITGADAWTAAFVLMALVMVLTRVLVTATAVARSGRPRRQAVTA